MTKSRLNYFRKKLLRAREDILRDLEIDQSMFNLEQEGDMADLADNLITNEFYNYLSDMDAKKLRLIDAALRKIDDGTYGICAGSGQPIPEERLEAVPWTPYTVEYARRMEMLGAA